MKSRWMDDRLQLNLAAFRTVISDQQVLRLPQVGVTIIDNAGETSTDGVDVSFTALPLPELRFDVNATFQKARFDEYDTIVAGQPASYADNHQLRSPDQTVSVTSEYTVPLESSSSVRLRAEYFYQSEIFFDAANSSYDGAFQPGYGVLNGSVTFTAADGAYDVSLYGKNLNDEEYYRNVAIQGRYGLAVPGDPLTFGLRFSWRYR
jgi:iron complex outermembrane receptor protein